MFSLARYSTIIFKSPPQSNPSSSENMDSAARSKPTNLPIHEPRKLSSGRRLKVWCRDIFMIFDGHARKKMRYLGRIVTITMMVAIIIGIVSTVLSTNPAQMIMPTSCDRPVCNNDPILCPGKKVCAPVGKPSFIRLNDAVTIIFIIDYGVRLSTVWACNSRQADLLPMSWYEKHKPSDPPPVYELHWQYFHFVCSLRNLIDLAAILPFFIHIAIPSTNINNNFVRILRLVRVFGLMNRNPTVKQMLAIVLKTLMKSSYALGVLLLLSIIGVIFFAAIIFAVEGGEFRLTTDFPDGAFLRKAWIQGESVYVVTPFNSIGTCIYYVITTMTTVGYGDLAPTTVSGRAVANLMMYVGVVLLALPIGVISSNFSFIYHKDLRLSRQGKPVDDEAIDWYECEDASDGEEAVKHRRATVMLHSQNSQQHDRMIKSIQEKIASEKRTNKSIGATKRSIKDFTLMDAVSAAEDSKMAIDNDPPAIQRIHKINRQSEGSASSHSSDDVSSVSSNSDGSDNNHRRPKRNKRNHRHAQDNASHESRSGNQSRYEVPDEDLDPRIKYMPWMRKPVVPIDSNDKHQALTVQLASMERTLAALKQSLAR